MALQPGPRIAAKTCTNPIIGNSKREDNQEFGNIGKLRQGIPPGLW